MSDAFSERMRLIRLRRKIEKPRFRDELKLIPKWLVWTLAFLYVVAVVLAIVINLYQDGGQSIQPSQLRGNPALASLAMAGIVTAVAIVLSVWLMALGYVYRDAKRRDMLADRLDGKGDLALGALLQLFEKVVVDRR